MTIINTEIARSLRRSLRTASRLLTNVINVLPHVEPARCSDLLDALIQVESLLERIAGDGDEAA